MNELNNKSLYEEEEDCKTQSLGVEINYDYEHISLVQADTPIKTICKAIDNKELELKAEYDDIWKNDKISKIIETILLGIPLPLIYLAEKRDKTIVIDGKKRLLAIYKYIKNEIRLSGLVIFSSLNNLTFDGLDGFSRDKILNFTVRTVTFFNIGYGIPRYEVFSRFLTQSFSHSAHDFRNRYYSGPFTDFSKELAGDESFVKITGLQSSDLQKYGNELVQRFFAFSALNISNYKPPIRILIDDACRFNNDRLSRIEKEKLNTVKEKFIQICSNILEVFGENCFRVAIKDSFSNKELCDKDQFHIGLYDILMWSFARVDSELLLKRKEYIKTALDKLLANDEDFKCCILSTSTSKEVIQQRFIIWTNTLIELFKDENEDLWKSIKTIK